MLVTGGLFLPSASCDQGGHRLWTSAIRRQPQYGLTQNPVLVTLTGPGTVWLGWKREDLSTVISSLAIGLRCIRIRGRGRGGRQIMMPCLL